MAADYFTEPAPSLQAQLDGFLARLGQDLAAQPWSQDVSALVLAGGYGRGEGGVFRQHSHAAPKLYNDLEFYLFTAPAAQTVLVEWCRRWEREGSAELELDVEFKVLAADALRRAEPSMFFFDLVQGHRVVWGDPAAVREVPAALRDPAAIPLEEVARLLFNRGSGLLFARWQLELDLEDCTGFVRRNHAKVRLALGDAVLAAAGRHDGSCLERARRLLQADFPKPANFEKLVRWHAEGVEFKLRPQHNPMTTEDLRRNQGELTEAWREVYLWVEEHRLRTKFPTAESYCDASGRLFPCTSRWRNLLIHGRDLLRRQSALPDWTDYPRAALMRALVAALEVNERFAAALLHRPAATWRTHYRRWWSFYN